MKIHELLVLEVARAVQTIFSDKTAYADKVIEKVLKNQRKWGSRDRRFFAESVYEMVRWWRYLWFLNGYDQDPTIQDINNVENLKSLWAVYWFWKKNDIQEKYLKTSIEKLSVRMKLQVPRAVQESIPSWLDHFAELELKQNWEPLLHALNQPAPVFLRVNLLKTTAPRLKDLLLSEGTEADILGDETIALKERKNIFLSKAFKDGMFEVQDWSSQQVAGFLDVQSGQRVVDACAGAGGKTLHLATHMKNKGKIIALDLYEWKLNELKTRARRDGIDIIETRVIENQKTIKRLEDSADRLLLDVPCSGLGVLRRNPDSKWKITEVEIQRLQKTQSEILQNYSRILKVGGKMVYATCSILPSENEMQIENFLKTEMGAKFKLCEQKRLQPNQCPGDGFYMALLERI